MEDIWAKRKTLQEMQERGATREEIAAYLNVPPERLERLGDRWVVITGNGASAIGHKRPTSIPRAFLLAFASEELRKATEKLKAERAEAIARGDDPDEVPF